MQRLERTVVAVGIVIAALAACGDDDDPSSDTAELSDDAVIEHRYGDASVEPSYHRSYSLTIRSDEVHVVIDSYGDVLNDTTVALPADVWNDLTENATALAEIDTDEVDDGCTGGTTRTIKITDQGQTPVELDFSVCGDTNSTAADRVDASVQPVIDAIPNWDALTA